MTLQLIRRMATIPGHFSSRLITSRMFSNEATTQSEATAGSGSQFCSDDAPVSDMENPFKKKKIQCILCKYKIELNYKNPRLLSQFISPLTGSVYDKHITGLCDGQQSMLTDMIKKSRYNGFMGYIYKDPRFKNDPKLFDPMRPTRPNPH